MGAECCTASSNKHDQILAQKTEYSLDEQPNEQAKKQIEFKKKQQTTLKTTFYGSAGVACSKTMTAQKNSKIQTVIQDYKGSILINNKQLQNITQEACEDEMTRKEPSKGTKNKDQKKEQISTAQMIDQQANFYMEGMANKLKQVDKIK